MRKFLTIVAAAVGVLQGHAASAQVVRVDCNRVPMQMKRQLGCPMPGIRFGIGVRIGSAGVGVGTGYGTSATGATRRIVGGPESGRTTIVEHPPGVQGQYRCWVLTGQPSGGPGSGDGYCVRNR
jgi:hypothetical protein